MADIDSKILGKFLLIQNTMHVMSNDKSLSEYVCHGINAVPGICSVWMCINGKLDEHSKLFNKRDGSHAINESPCAFCQYPSNPESVFLNHSCLWDKEKNICCISLQTESNRYGYFLINYDESSEFYKYKPYMENLANHVALIFENRRSNDVLKESKLLLEKIVEERTSELKKANDNLSEEIEVRKQAVKELKANLIKYQTLFASLPIGVTISDKDGMILESNKEAERLLKLPLEDNINKKIYDSEWHIIRPDGSTMPGNEYPSVRALKEKRLVENIEMGVIRGDGDVIWLNVTAAPIPIEPFGVIIVYNDITERKKIEEALHVEKERFSKAFRASPNPMTISRMADGTIMEVNQTWIETFGHSRAEAVGKTSVSIGIWGDPANRKKAMQKLQETGSLRNYEIDLWRKTGEVRHTLLSIECFEIEGEQYLIAIVHDITERKKMEEELLTSRKLESVGVLAGGIAHDFNNILTTIIGSIAIAKMQSKSDDEIFELLSEAEMASVRAQALTRQLLTFAKGGVPLKEIASIKEIIEESSLFVLRGSKSACEFSIAENLWPAEIDIGQISQVINNIVINANQAMPEGGIIQIAAENLIIDDRHELPLKTGRYISISIKDQGIGIAEKHISNVFDPYFTTKQKGNGLGLATTYSIIKKHDGHITVESQLGVGTTFYIYLPASDKTVSEKEDVQLITGHGRILVMDDEASLRRTFGRVLQKLGYEPEFAKDGVEAIEMFKEAKESKKPYDAVILDLTVPGGMGGKEAIEKLLEIDPEVKAIVSSGYSVDPVLANFKEYGFKGVFPKPFETQLLSKVLHEVLKEENNK
ncbi:MAG: PAS domain S-box protein [Pseudomonadota bacterium]